MHGGWGILTLRLNAPCSPQEVAVTDAELEVELAVKDDDSVRRIGSMEMVGIKKDGATMPDGGAVAVEPVKVSIPADSMLDKNSAMELIFAGSTVVMVGITKDGATKELGASVTVDLVAALPSLVLSTNESKWRDHSDWIEAGNSARSSVAMEVIPGKSEPVTLGIKKDGATTPDGGAVAVDPVKVSIPADSMLDKNSAMELIFAGSTVVTVGIKKDGATRSDGASVIVDLVSQSASLVSVPLLGESLQEERVTSGRRMVWTVESDTEISETTWENSEECDVLSVD